MERIWMRNWPEGVAKELYYRLGKRPLHEYLQINAEQSPNQIAYIFYGRKMTWQELNRKSDQLARFLQVKGVTKGDRIGLFMQNCPQYIISHYAIQKIGAIVSPLNPMYKSAELEYSLNEIGATALIAGEELYPLIEDVSSRAPSLHLVVTAYYGDYLPETPTLPLPEELKSTKKAPDESYDLNKIFETVEVGYTQENVSIHEDVSLMVFTSGTTGRPKGAMLTYENALFKTAASVHSNDIQSDDTWLSVMPLCHIAGMVMGVNIPVYTKTPCVLLTRFDPEVVIKAIEMYKVTTWYSIAPMNVAILGVPDIEDRNLKSLRKNIATSFGIPITEALAKQWRKRIIGCELYEAAYGLSETHTCDTFMPYDRVRFGSCGIPTYETDIRIVDVEDQTDLQVGEKGEIVVKNPGVFKGYWNRPDATKETLKDGWMHTGDIGYISEEGYLYFCGRVKEMIKSSGYSVFPEDVEQIIMNHPAVAQVAVIGVPDDKRGESVKAFIVCKEADKGQVDEQEIIEWSKQNMAAFKYPRSVEFRTSLPATGTGKVLRRLLKEEFETKE